MRISPFTPLFFIDRKADGHESEYVQTFAATDIITLQIICSPEESPVAHIIDECSGIVTSDVEFRNWKMNSGVTLYYARLRLPVGTYSLVVDGLAKSRPFTVTDDEDELEDTVLIQYSNRDNRQRTDAVFLVDGERIFFDFRVHGGFKDSNWAFSVESEQFSDEYANIVQLFGLESTQKRFTMGGSDGVPVWFGELLNRLLVCSYVYFDGEQYVRKESNVPEITQTQEGVNSFTFLQTLQSAVNIDTETDISNRIYLRRIDGREDYRVTEDLSQRVTIY